MNLKRFLLAAVGVFVVGRVLDYLIHWVLLRTDYEATQQLWRTEAEMKTGLLLIVGAITALLFVYIFTKGYEGRGLLEGVRYGLIIGLFVSIPMAYNSYAVMPIPYSLALEWFLYGLAEYIILGIVAAALYRPKAATGS